MYSCNFHAIIYMLNRTDNLQVFFNINNHREQVLCNQLQAFIFKCDSFDNCNGHLCWAFFKLLSKCMWNSKSKANIVFSLVLYQLHLSIYIWILDANARDFSCKWQKYKLLQTHVQVRQTICLLVQLLC